MDEGSSMNIILLDVLTRMNIPESEIIKRSSIVMGFSGETKHTIGEIKLPKYIEGLNSMQGFYVNNALPSYSVILVSP